MSNQYIAETYLSFGEIPEADGGDAIEQIHLPLTRPYNLGEWFYEGYWFLCLLQVNLLPWNFLFIFLFWKTDTDCIRALEYRIGDKQAKEFLKKLKQKINNQA